MVAKDLRPLARQMNKRRLHQGVSLADQKRLKERREKALNLRIAGATLQDIVNAGIGYNNMPSVSQDLEKALGNFYAEDIEQLLILDLARLDEMQKYCTAAMRMGDTSQVRNLMAIMQFRRETIGVTPESIQDRRINSAQVVNNGIMVVQGTQREYLATMMEAAGAEPDEIARELKELENTSQNTSGSQEVPKEVGTTPVPTGESGNAHAIAGTRVIQGELITRETGPVTQDTSQNGSSNPKKKSSTGKTLKIVRKRKTSTEQPALPGSSQATTATQEPAQAQKGTRAPSSDSILLADRVEALAATMDEEQEERTQMRLGRLDDPAIEVDVEALEERLSVLHGETRDFPVKLPDANVPVSPGVVYRTAPRKLSQEEGSKEVSRRLKKPAPTVDRVRTRVHTEEI